MPNKLVLMVLVLSMFGYNLDNTMIMIIIIAVVFGAISAAFFTMGRSKKRPIEASVDGYNTDGGGSGKFCTSCGAPAGIQSSAEIVELKSNFFFFHLGYVWIIMVLFGKLIKDALLFSL